MSGHVTFVFISRLYIPRIFLLNHIINLEAQAVKNLPAMQKTWVRSPDQEDPLENGVATHSSVLAWEIPWTEKPGGLQAVGSPRIGHGWATNIIRVAKESWGLLSSNCRANRPHLGLCPEANVPLHLM